VSNVRPQTDEQVAVPLLQRMMAKVKGKIYDIANLGTKGIQLLLTMSVLVVQRLLDVNANGMHTWTPSVVPTTIEHQANVLLGLIHPEATINGEVLGDEKSKQLVLRMIEELRAIGILPKEYEKIDEEVLKMKTESLTDLFAGLESVLTENAKAISETFEQKLESIAKTRSPTSGAQELCFGARTPNSHAPPPMTGAFPASPGSGSIFGSQNLVNLESSGDQQMGSSLFGLDTGSPGSPKPMSHGSTKSILKFPRSPLTRKQLFGSKVPGRKLMRISAKSVPRSPLIAASPGTFLGQSLANDRAIAAAASAQQVHRNRLNAADKERSEAEALKSREEEEEEEYKRQLAEEQKQMSAEEKAKDTAEKIKLLNDLARKEQLCMKNYPRVSPSKLVAKPPSGQVLQGFPQLFLTASPANHRPLVKFEKDTVYETFMCEYFSVADLTHALVILPYVVKYWTEVQCAGQRFVWAINGHYIQFLPKFDRIRMCVVLSCAIGKKSRK
jgi:hypothetical protein